MLNQLRRPAPPRPAVDDGYLACYGVVVACASLLLLTILAATVSIGKACALAGAVAATFGLVGCVSKWCAGDGAAVAGAPPVPPATGTPCLGATAVDVLPAFAFTTTTDAESGSSKAGRRCCALCSVCLEDVQPGETVRRLPACRHLFHVACIDVWLRSHRTCPLCRCDVWARPPEAKAKPAPAPEPEPEPEAEPPDTTTDALPPV